MITKDDSPSGIRAGGVLGTVAALALGLLVGRGWDTGASGIVAPAAPPEGGIFAPPPAPPAFDAPGSALADLPLLQVDLDAEPAAALARARQRALDEGLIVQRPDDLVPARVGSGGTPWPARVRLKGDYLDHVDSDKWSLRVELERGALFGMSRFSIQHPKVRGWLAEWLILAAARREGLLAPRARFVRVAVNGRPTGVWYLEEHFSKELLESQGRRDGPIVRLDEKTLWSGWLLFNPQKGQRTPPALVFSGSPGAAEVAAYDEDRLASTAALNDRLQRALAQMRDWKRLILATTRENAWHALRSLEELQGRTADDLFATSALGRMLALYSLFRTEHGLSWINMRFYYDTLLDRLEPFVFDTGAGLGRSPQLLVTHPGIQELLRSDSCYEEAFRSMARMADPGYVDALLAEVGPELQRYAAALREDGADAASCDVGRLAAELRSNAREMRDVLALDDAANFDARLVAADGTEQIEVEAWTTSAVPVEVQGFRLDDGREVPAAAAVTAEDAAARRADGSVMLLRPGRHVVFRFPLDTRLAGLHDVQQIKRAIRSRTAPDEGVKVRVDVLHRSIGGGPAAAERLPIRNVDPADPRGRPAWPTLAEAVERHRCLAYSVEHDRLFLRPGSWDVEGDLLVPPGQLLHAGGGVTLRFAPGAVFASGSPLALAGQATHPIVLEPSDPAAGWGGLFVAQTGVESTLAHVVVRGAAAVERGGWQTTGGVTFYRARVAMRDCRVEDARGEDALNIVGAPFTLERTTFDGAVSDLFDGDFVDGVVRDCTFARARGDGVDVSGSRVQVEACRFTALGDKAISVGENSRATVERCVVDGAGIALAAKDLSEVDVRGLDVRSVDGWVLAAYVKKPEYGPAAIRARELALPASGATAHLVQQGCTVEIDGVALPGETVAVDALYRRTR